MGSSIDSTHCLDWRWRPSRKDKTYMMVWVKHNFMKSSILVLQIYQIAYCLWLHRELAFDMVAFIVVCMILRLDIA